MGAISVAFPIGQVVVGLGLLFGNGAGLLYLPAFGKGRQENGRSGGKYGPVQQYCGWCPVDSVYGCLSASPFEDAGGNGKYSALCGGVYAYLCGVLNF